MGRQVAEGNKQVEPSRKGRRALRSSEEDGLPSPCPRLGEKGKVNWRERESEFFPDQLLTKSNEL